jgi:hypothetical protein
MVDEWNQVLREDGHSLPEPEVVRLARTLGSVSQACRELGVDRSVYYRAMKRQRGGQETHGRSQLAKSPALENMILNVCLDYPDWGCDRLAWYLTLKGESISSPTVQKILLRHGLGRAAQRRLESAQKNEQAARLRNPQSHNPQSE